MSWCEWISWGEGGGRVSWGEGGGRVSWCEWISWSHLWTHDGVTYGLVGRKRTPKLQCLLCTRHCGHVSLFHEWCEENDIDLEGDAASPDAVPTYPSCSHRSVSI